MGVEKGGYRKYCEGDKKSANFWGFGHLTIKNL